jgi:glyoxylase-like metal-dependent hydrolase (beta-lactamase superfamily II)
MSSVLEGVSIHTFTFNPFETNTFVVVSDGEAAIIDASPYTEGDVQQVMSCVEAAGARVVHLLLTHAHIDHVFGCAPIAELCGVGWSMHAADQELLDHAAQQAAVFGVRLADPPRPTARLQGGDTVVVGKSTLEVRHVPGHSPGSVAFVDQTHGFVLAGDVLFRGSIGRTDLWQGSYPQLIASIRDEMLTLPDETAVFCGHGPATTIGEERRSNPFLQP